jgi:mannose-6-phosphate isomerase
MESTKREIIQLSPFVQNYAWGILGIDNLVANYYKLQGNDVDPKKNYAELWMGTHPSGPSKVSPSGLLLKEYLNSHPDSVGEIAQDFFERKDELPFLFKILSIEKGNAHII